MMHTRKTCQLRRLGTADCLRTRSIGPGDFHVHGHGEVEPEAVDGAAGKMGLFRNLLWL